MTDGIVKETGYSDLYGNYVLIDHGDFDTFYAHLSEVFVVVTDSAFAGNSIGVAGNTGQSYGAHLHFEVRVDGQKVDPRLYLGLE